MKEQKQEQLKAQKPKQEKLDRIQQNGNGGEHLKRHRPELKRKLSSVIKGFSESTSAHGPPKVRISYSDFLFKHCLAIF